MSAFTHLSMVQAAAIFTSTLAYPQAKDHGKRERVAAALICAVIDDVFAHGNGEDDAPESLRLVCRLRDRRECEQLIKDATRIISSQRLIAAKQAWPRLQSSACDAVGIRRPAEVPGPSSREMIAAVAADLGDPSRQRSSKGRKASGGEAEGNKSNILKRCWEPTLPVLHMAIALMLEIGEGRPGMDLAELLYDADLAERLILNSTAYAEPVSQTFGIADQVMIAPFGVQIN